VGLIEKYSEHLSYWISEPDDGQSSAINKGLAKCTGEIFNWLNSDDLLCPGALVAVAKAWAENRGSIIAGSLSMFRGDGSEKIVTSNALTRRTIIRWWEGSSQGSAFWQPATFLPLENVLQAGGVREDLHLVMDLFLLVQLLAACPVTYIPDVLARFRRHEQSKTQIMGGLRFRLEFAQALLEMDEIPEISRRELRDETAKVLVSCADLEGSENNFIAAVGHLARASRLSARTTLSELCGKRPVRRLCRKLLWG
jgi:hypothetical protein